MPKALDVAYVLYQVPDLDKMESFMTDFGLTRAARTADALYMRGAGPAPFMHGTLRGDTPRFVGGAFRMGSSRDLEALAKTAGASAVEPVDGPGGGQRVRMTMPDGARIDAIFGAEDAPPLAFRSPNPFNAAQRKERTNASLRPRRGPMMSSSSPAAAVLAQRAAGPVAPGARCSTKSITSTASSSSTA